MRFYRWVVELEVEEVWVEDGFTLTDEDVPALLLNGRLGYAREEEVRGRVLEVGGAPSRRLLNLLTQEELDLLEVLELRRLPLPRGEAVDASELEESLQEMEATLFALVETEEEHPMGLWVPVKVV